MALLASGLFIASFAGAGPAIRTHAIPHVPAHEHIEPKPFKPTPPEPKPHGKSEVTFPLPHGEPEPTPRVPREHRALELGHGTTKEELATKLGSSDDGNILVSSPELLPIARKLVAGGPPRLVLLKRSDGQVDAQLRRLSEHISTVDTLFSLPGDVSEAIRVHGEVVARTVGPEFWVRQRTAFESTLSRGSDLGSARQSGESYAAALLRQLQSSSAHLLLVIGEVRGGALRFPDGSAVPTADVNRPDGKLVGVVGCTSARHAAPEDTSVFIGTGRQIDYDEAIDIAQKFESAAHKGGGSFVPRDLLIEFQNSSSSSERAIVGVARFRAGVTESAMILELERA